MRMIVKLLKNIIIFQEKLFIFIHHYVSIFEDRRKNMRNKNLLLPRKDEVIYAQNIYGKINKNSLVIGSAGSGKTFGYIQPNICQMNASYIITDPKGEIFL